MFCIWLSTWPSIWLALTRLQNSPKTILGRWIDEAQMLSLQASAFKGWMGNLDLHGMGAGLTDGLAWLSQDSFCPLNGLNGWIFLNPFWFLSLSKVLLKQASKSRASSLQGRRWTPQRGKVMKMWQHEHVAHAHTFLGVCEQQLRKYWKEGTGMNRCTNTLGNMQSANTLTGRASVSILMRWTLDQFAFIANTIPTWRRLQPCRSKLWIGLAQIYFFVWEWAMKIHPCSTIRISHRTLWNVHMS